MVGINLTYKIEDKGSHLLYKRNNVEVLVSKDLKIVEEPVLSINNNVTDFFGLILEKPVYVAPNSETKNFCQYADRYWNICY